LRLTFKAQSLLVQAAITYRIKIAFLLLVLLQAFHSIEEYIGKLWEIFPPAAFLCGLVCNNLETGFLIINSGLFVFGIFCLVYCIKKDIIHLTFFLWFWVTIELINGFGHPLWSLTAKAYEPGLITAPFLLIVSLYLAKLLLRPTTNSLAK
jgi:hypothetical protein